MAPATITDRGEKCPIMGEGEITPAVIQKWEYVCKRYAKLSKRTTDEVVPLVASATAEPRLQQWHQADQERIDNLSFVQYFAELRKNNLPRDWAHVERLKILSSCQAEDVPFHDWRTELENANAQLSAGAPTFALSAEAMRSHMEANARPALSAILARKFIQPTTGYNDWADEVRDRDLELREHQKIVDDTIASRAAERKQQRSLLARLGPAVHQ